MSEGSRRFPPPWQAEKIPGGYVVRDANGQALACVYGRATQPRPLRPRFLRPKRQDALQWILRACLNC